MGSAEHLVLAGSTALVDPQSFAVAGSIIAVADQGDSALKVFDRYNGRLIATAGRRGAGPCEFRNIWSLQAIRSQDEVNLWLFDSRIRRLTGFTVSDNGKLTCQPRTLQPHIPGAPLALQWISDSQLVVVGYLWGGRFGTVDSLGTFERALGKVPLATDPKLVFAAQQALQPTLAINRGHQRIAIAARYAGRVDIYDVHTGLLIPVAVPLPFEPDLQAGLNRGVKDSIPIFRPDQHTRFGYVSIAASRSRLYALFSGRTSDDAPGRANLGRDVHIFDWEGRLLGTITLERDTYCLAVDESDSTLYGLTLDPDTWIYSRALSSLELQPVAILQSQPRHRFP